MKKRIATLVLSAISVIAFASPAMAEGSWGSYWSYVVTGIDTRTWLDNNSDTVGTYTKFRLCDYVPGAPYTLSNITAQLTYENTFTPDENMGQVLFTCNRVTWISFNYGRVKAGNYHETLIKVDGSVRPPAYVNVGTSGAYGLTVLY